MANTCKTCARSDVDEINALIMSQMSLRKIAVTKSIPYQSMYRHKEKCIDGLIAEVREERRSGLLAKLDEVIDEIEDVKAEFGNDGTLRDKLIGRKFTAIELEAKLTGAFIKDAPNPKDIADELKRYEAALKKVGFPAELIPGELEEYRRVQDETAGAVS